MEEAAENALKRTKENFEERKIAVKCLFLRRK